MRKLITTILVAAFSSGYALPQVPKVKSATKQVSNGGMAGHHGITYRIVVESAKRINIDSIYITGKGFKLIDPHNGRGNLSFDSAKHEYNIIVGESYVDPGMYVDKQPDKGNNTKAGIPAPRLYTGEAIITYTVGGVKQLLLINKMESLPTLNYP